MTVPISQLGLQYDTEDFMWKATVVDKDYGSVNVDNLLKIQAEYKKRGIDLTLAHYKNEDEIIEGCRDSDAILATGNPPISRKVLESLPKLKLVQRFGIGVNSVDLKAASDLNKLILFMPGFCIDELATHATAMILSLVRNLGYYDRGIRAGQWPKAQNFVPKSVDALTLGLYGFGGSARSLYEIFRNGFKSKVITCDPYMPESARKKYDVEFVDFETLLKQSDIISLHAPLNDETKHIFNREAFLKMRKESMIVNIARGELINEKDLIEALANGTIRFAGLDVFEKEPINADNPLLRMDNVILSCHSAFYGVGLSIDLVASVLNDRRIERKYIANQAVVGKVPDIQVF
jgi:D-3-phosphoglycerate dehydrogenase